MNNGDSIIEESIMSKIGEKIRHHKDESTIQRNWNNNSGKLKRNVYEAKHVSDKEFNEIVDCFKSMKNSNKFHEYKKYFDKLCKICMMSPEGCIIQHYDLQRGKGHDNNYVLITYSNTRQKITIPKGSRLYHTTTYVDETIKELKPVFQGKAARGFLYSSPRVYLTIRKDMPKFFMDIYGKQKTRMYVTKENIRHAYIDPLVPGFKYGAVYVETQFPIPVEEVKPQKDLKKEAEKLKKEAVEYMDDNTVFEFVEDDTNFASLEEFCEYYGLQVIDDDEVIEESFSAKIGKVSRKKNDNEYLKNIWKNLSSKISHKTVKKELKDKEYNILTSNFEILKTSKEYGKYKKAYETICKMFNLVPSETTIRNISFDEKDGKHYVTIQYHVGKKKILIPNGTQLIHTSKESNIKELKPTFCSKKRGYYMWPTRRVYFTLGKKINENLVGIKGNNSTAYHYTPKENIRTAYIDAELPDYNMGAVFVDTQFPISVRNIDKQSK